LSQRRAELFLQQLQAIDSEAGNFLEQSLRVQQNGSNFDMMVGKDLFEYLSIINESMMNHQEKFEFLIPTKHLQQLCEYTQNLTLKDFIRKIRLNSLFDEQDYSYLKKQGGLMKSIPKFMTFL
jgi:hypothetical protein